jgi:hypothetical protein
LAGFSSAASIANSRIAVIKTRSEKLKRQEIKINTAKERLHAILATRYAKYFASVLENEV